MTDDEDPEKRIADLERQLAEQKRIAELERQIADAKAAAPGQGAPFGRPFGQGGDATQLGDALSQAAAQAGMTREQLDDALQHANVRMTPGHTVVYTSQGGTYPNPGGAPLTFGNVSRRTTSGTGLNIGTLIGYLGGAFGLTVGGAAALTAAIPSSALWTSRIICGGPNQLIVNTSHYSYRPGQSGTSVGFECLTPGGATDAGFVAISALQSGLVAFVLAGLAGAYFLIRSMARRQPMRQPWPIVSAAAAAVGLVVMIAVGWQVATSSSAPAQLPPGGSLTVKGNGDSKTIACNDGHITVNGREMTVTITGHCASLSVDGVIHHITVDSVDTIDVNGLNNVIVYHSGSPKVSNSGFSNSVSQG